MSSELENWFPKLANTEYEVTSPRTFDYNCIAWAVEEDDRWWSPTSDDYYWPENIPLEWTVDTVIQMFQLFGYEVCEGVELELGYQRIALYAKADGEPSHVARQLPNGKWTSKLGDWEDIEHLLDGIEGDGMYGQVIRILKRAV
jgi:hypothetical protein